MIGKTLGHYQILSLEPVEADSFLRKGPYSLIRPVCQSEWLEPADSWWK